MARCCFIMYSTVRTVLPLRNYRMRRFVLAEIASKNVVSVCELIRLVFHMLLQC